MSGPTGHQSAHPYAPFLRALLIVFVVRRVVADALTPVRCTIYQPAHRTTQDERTLLVGGARQGALHLSFRPDDGGGDDGEAERASAPAQT